MRDADFSDFIFAIFLFSLICLAAFIGYKYGSSKNPLNSGTFIKWFTDGYQTRIDFEHEMGAGLTP